MCIRILQTAFQSRAHYWVNLITANTSLSRSTCHLLTRAHSMSKITRLSKGRASEEFRENPQGRKAHGPRLCTPYILAHLSLDGHRHNQSGLEASRGTKKRSLLMSIVEQGATTP